MKHSIKSIFILATIVILAIAAYQAYWLTDIYSTLQANFSGDVSEAMRSADFEEINNRVNKLREEGYGGSMSVSVGSEKSHEQVGVKNEYHEGTNKNSDESANQSSSETETELSQEELPKEEEEVSNTVPYDDFSNSLKDEEALRRVGLYMQKGIHDGLDAIIPVCPVCYDSLLCKKLDSLGISRRHTTLYIQKTEADIDTLLIGSPRIAQADTFSITLNSLESKQYILLLERPFISIPHKMHSALLFSAFTLLILILAFWYIINMIRRMRDLDEMKTDFTNNITHELKTPIAVAYAANDALLNFGESNSPEKLKKYLTICQDQLTLLTQLVEQILSLSMEKRKTMKLNIEPIALAPVINKIVENHQLKTKKPLTIDLDVPASITVLSDKIHLNNIINNLVDNAVKYSGESLHLTIKAKRQVDGTIVLTIADNGIGISDEQQRYIFDKFYRVPHGNVHQVKGYGLGLYYVKTMLKKLGGSVSLKSEVGSGTTFKLTFNGEN